MTPDPTPEEIRAACEAIRATWTARERWVRSGFRDQAAGLEAGMLSVEATFGKSAEGSNG